MCSPEETSRREVGQVRKEFEMGRLSNGPDSGDSILLDGDYSTGQLRSSDPLVLQRRTRTLRPDNRVFEQPHRAVPFL